MVFMAVSGIVGGMVTSNKCAAASVECVDEVNVFLSGKTLELGVVVHMSDTSFYTTSYYRDSDGYGTRTRKHISFQLEFWTSLPQQRANSYMAPPSYAAPPSYPALDKAQPTAPCAPAAEGG